MTPVDNALVELANYDGDLLAFADLRGGNEYMSDDPNLLVECEVCAIVLARLGPTAGGIAEDTLLISLDSQGDVIDDTLYLAPREAMESWPKVTWEPLAGVSNVEAFVRARMTS
jgi:hypothetical protein